MEIGKRSQIVVSISNIDNLFLVTVWYLAGIRVSGIQRISVIKSVEKDIVYKLMSSLVCI